MKPYREKLGRMMETIVDYFDIRNEDAGVWPILDRLVSWNAEMNVRLLMMEPKAKFYTVFGSLGLFMLFAHSGSTLLTTLALLSLFVIVLGAGTFAFIHEAMLDDWDDMMASDGHAVEFEDGIVDPDDDGLEPLDLADLEPGDLTGSDQPLGDLEDLDLYRDKKLDEDA